MKRRNFLKVLAGLSATPFVKVEATSIKKISLEDFKRIMEFRPDVALWLGKNHGCNTLGETRNLNHKGLLHLTDHEDKVVNFVIDSIKTQLDAENIWSHETNHRNEFFDLSHSLSQPTLEYTYDEWIKITNTRYIKRLRC